MTGVSTMSLLGAELANSVGVGRDKMIARWVMLMTLEIHLIVLQFNKYLIKRGQGVLPMT